mgnify:CR=1 FL=1
MSTVGGGYDVQFEANTNNPTIQFVRWECDSYWEYEYMGELFIVPIINSSSYTDEDGYAHTMFSPHISLLGDTVRVYVGYQDSNNGIEYSTEFDIILY